MQLVEPRMENDAAGGAGRAIASFINSYARLPGRFFARVGATPVASPRLIQFNQPLAHELGIETASLNADQLAGSSQATLRCPAPNRSHSRMRDISSASLFPSSATGARFFWARSRIATARGTTSSSRAPGRRLSRGAAMGARRWDQYCGSISSARR
jgi:hypothetical protein